MKMLIRGGRVIDPSRGLDKILDIFVKGGKIKDIAANIAMTDPSCTVIDATGKIVAPGLLDIHVHLREPGHEYKETILSGCEAAVAGGFTSIASMANTNPANDNHSVTEFIIRKAEAAGIANVFPVAALSIGLEGKLMTEFADLKEAGAAALSDDGKPVKSASFMRKALEYAASLDLPVISHCEDTTLSAGGQINEGIVSTALGLQGIPSAAEEIMVARDIALAEYCRAPVHIAHVSAAGSVRLIREAKARGVMVTAETAPHYFTLTEEALRNFSTNCKMHPPLRSAEDVRALKEGLGDGTIDAIASDHAPHSSIEKDLEFDYAANGIIGLETSLALSLELVAEGVLSLASLIEKMTVNPARILKLPKGTLSSGADADITIIDSNRSWIADVETFRSKSRNSPFQGRPMHGKAVMTIVGGIVKYSDA